MKAAVLTEYGDVDKLVVTHIPEPEAGPRDLTVRVTAAGINPIDLKLRRGELRAFMPMELPTVLGRDVAGEVVGVGKDVTEFQVGDRVMGMVQHAYAEIVVAPAESFAKLPAELEPVQAAALPMVGLTGVQLVDEAIAPSEGDLVLVTGAVGSVGRVAVAEAKARGATVIAGVRSRQKPAAMGLGADDVIGLDEADDLARLPPLDAVADTVDGEVIERLLDKIKPGGVLGTVFSEPKSAKAHDLTVRAILVHPDAQRLRELGEAFAHGELKLPIDARFPLSEVRMAQELAERSGVGKVLLVM